MKKIVLLSLSLIVVFSQDYSYAAKKPSGEQAVDAKRAESRKILAAKKEELNGSEWTVILSSGDPKGGSEKDVLTFQNGQVTSQVLTKRGFNSTNYTISVPESSDMAVWETMQTSDKGGVIFIRGEWKADTMRGIYSEQVEGGTKDHQFATESKVAVAPTTEKPKEEKPVEVAAVAVAEEVTVPQVEEEAPKAETEAVPDVKSAKKK